MWRGSRDGFGAGDFHEKCDGKGPTLTVVKTEKGNVFGAYTDLDWESGGGFVEGTGRSFLFKVNEDQSVSISECVDKSKETFNHSSYGPTFGFGDLCIRDKCDQNYGSVTNLGRSYSLTHYLDAGNHFFKVQEVEVFLIK